MQSENLDTTHPSTSSAAGSLPLVTFLLLTYKQAAYIEEALRGALSQTYSRLEIIVSDDCSPDDTYEIALRLAAEYQGPHRIIVRRNQHNLGLIGHLCAAMRETRGELIVAAAGDDVSYPQRVEKVVQAWIANGRQSGSIFSRFKTIDNRGTIVSNRTTPPTTRFTLSDRPLDMLEAVSVGVLGCAHAWTRDVFEIFGDIDPRAVHEDVTIPLRSLLVGSLTFMPDELVLYRLTSGSLSRHAFAGHRERMRKMARYWAGRLANYEQFRKDAQVASELQRVDPQSLEWARTFFAEKERLARRNVEFFSAGAVGRFRVPLEAWTQVPWRQTLKWLVIALAPWSYGFQRSR